MLNIGAKGPVCEDCYDYEKAYQIADPNGDTLPWGELPPFVPAYQQTISDLEARLAAAEERVAKVWEEAAEIAERHRPKRDKALGSYAPEDREIIRAEENGEAIAASIIATAIRALAKEPSR